MMVRIYLSIIFASICLSLSAQQQQKNEADVDQIKKIIQISYVEGLQNEGDTVKINQGFHPGFEMLVYNKDGSLKKYAINEWKKRITDDRASGTMPRKADARISVKFLNVDVTGNAATAKFEFYVGSKLTFIDYMFLYKYDGTWKIVSKIYYRFP